MVQYAIIDRQSFMDRAWMRFQDYRFCEDLALVPLVGTEMGRAATAFPLAFSRINDVLMPVGLLGLSPGQNLFVSPDGRWQGPYVPAALRAHPFALLRPSSNSQPVLCIQADSGLLMPAGTPCAERFFEEDGSPSAPVQEVVAFLGQVEASRLLTVPAVAALEAAGILVPWPIETEIQDKPHVISDILRVDEARLNALPDDVFLGLRQANALPLAYAHLLSVGRLAYLRTLQAARLPIPSGPPMDLAGTALGSFFDVRNDDVNLSWNIPSS